jgi:uncharacterized protein (UPF0335 family)
MKQETPVITDAEARRLALENILPFIREQAAAFATPNEATPDPDNCRKIGGALREIEGFLNPGGRGRAATETRDEQRIRRAFSGMPFGGISNFDFDLPMNPARVAENLERLKSALETVVEESKQTAAELQEYGEGVRAMRTLLRLAFGDEIKRIVRDALADDWKSRGQTMR